MKANASHFTNTQRLFQSQSRREFLQKAMLAGASLTMGLTTDSRAEVSSGEMPMRVLGRTKARVSILGLGTAPIGEARVEMPQAVRIFGEVMDQGVNYIDTARGYGIAEEALGQLVPSRRDRLFLVTKVWVETAVDAEKSLTESLRQLKVDHVDLVHIHHIGGKNLDKVLAKDGVLEYLLRQRQAGKLRFIGISGHARPPHFLKLLQTGQIDVVMAIMNYADRNIYDFEGVVLPECRKQNVGVVAMKVYVGIKGGFPNHRKGWVGCNTPPEKLSKALAYALDLDGVSVANIGPFTLEQARKNIDLARQYKPLTTPERDALLAYGKELAPTLGPRYGPIA
ncbi:MAG TPA: aldo/keto reductase [Candidatus Paceibacterota bacterium]|nr:aldo/keto reductase [Verrucomicrobiota bacterium]HRY50446.1 aldo/keto reductase [Candidatus Paceibacterota bacterium]HSA01588.1 aldo/keto reductase [Candidatus Paceibacterota bacterium]